MFYNKAVYIKKGYKQMKPNFDPAIEECIKEAGLIYICFEHPDIRNISHTVTGFLLMLLLSSLITSSPRLTIV